MIPILSIESVSSTPEWHTLTLKSMNPFLSMSNVRKTWSQNSSAFPLGKNILYISTNLAGVRRPLGQSCCSAHSIRPTGDKIKSSNNNRRSKRRVRAKKNNDRTWPVQSQRRRSNTPIPWQSHAIACSQSWPVDPTGGLSYELNRRSFNATLVANKLARNHHVFN